MALVPVRMPRIRSKTFSVYPGTVKIEFQEFLLLSTAAFEGKSHVEFIFRGKDRGGRSPRRREE